MKGVNVLKITKEMWRDIDSGIKNVDIRKLSKDYIQVGNDIVFIDLNTYEHYGTKQCIGKLYTEPSNVGYSIKHKPTIEFVHSNYMEEQLLILFTLGGK